MEQKVPMRQFRRAIAEAMNIQVRVQLHDEDVPASFSSQFFINRQDSEMISRYPKKKLSTSKNLAGELAAALSPRLVRRQGVECDFADADGAFVSARPRRNAL